MQFDFCRYFWTVTCVFYARRAGQVSFSFPFQRAVIHIRRKRSTSRLFLIFFLLFKRVDHNFKTSILIYFPIFCFILSFIIGNRICRLFFSPCTFFVFGIYWTSFKIVIENVIFLWPVAVFQVFGFFFLWLSFKIVIENTDLSWQTIRNISYRDFIVLIFLSVLYFNSFLSHEIQYVFALNYTLMNLV